MSYLTEAAIAVAEESGLSDDVPLAGEYLLNPLTVSRALQLLVDEQLIEVRRGLGMFVQAGAAERVPASARARFLAQEWPLIGARLGRLGRLSISPDELDWTP